MASRTPGPTTKGKIGDTEVEETTMMPNVPPATEERPAISNEEFEKKYGKVMTPEEVEEELNNQY